MNDNTQLVRLSPETEFDAWHYTESADLAEENPEEIADGEISVSATGNSTGTDTKQEKIQI